MNSPATAPTPARLLAILQSGPVRAALLELTSSSGQEEPAFVLSRWVGFQGRSVRSERFRSGDVPHLLNLLDQVETWAAVRRELVYAKPAGLMCCSPFPRPPGERLEYFFPGELNFIAECADCGRRPGEWWVAVGRHEAVFLCTPCVWTRPVVPSEQHRPTVEALWALVHEADEHPLEWRHELAAVLIRYHEKATRSLPAEWLDVVLDNRDE